MAKKYADAEFYETKLEKVMSRFGVSSYSYDWTRFECWITFVYKGQHYRFSHSVANAQQHGIDVKYGSDAFAQLVLSLEDLARMVERGIYDLGTWAAGMKYLPESTIEPCFMAMGFSQRPSSEDEVKAQYRRMAKIMHPDAGGSKDAFIALEENYRRCLKSIQNPH